MTAQLDMFAEPPQMPIGIDPLVLDFRADGKLYGSGAAITIIQNADGSWSEGHDFHASGFTGSFHPVRGEYASFDEALTTAINRVRSNAHFVVFEANCSVVSEKHRASSRKVLAWLDGVEAEYGLRRAAA